MRDYRATWQYKSATTEDFRDALEASSGRDLNDFFQQWIYGEYYPVYHATWTSAVDDTAGWNVTVTLQQVQSWQLFHLPVDVTIATGSGDVTFVVDDSTASQQFVLHVSDTPTGITIDKDNWILKGSDPIVTRPTFERSVLLVNGVDWATYGSEIVNAYNAQAFWGTYPIDFWDVFPTPAGGYPGTLPAPLGHGSVPGTMLGHYRNVIWIGNNFSGDLASWQDSPILGYLRVGGNVLLLSRQGDQFLGDSLRSYLGVTLTNTDVTLNDCFATRPGLSNMTPIATQSLCAAFDTVRTTPESQLLFCAVSGFTPIRGLGAIRIPVAGAGNRPKGGRFAFVSGRPYRWNATQLKTNVMTILSNWFNELPGGLAVGDSPGTGLELSARPNPSTRSSMLRYAVPRGGRVRLILLDVAGRRVQTLVDGPVGPGVHEVAWNGRADRGDRVAAGIYWARLEAGGETRVTRLVRLDR